MLNYCNQLIKQILHPQEAQHSQKYPNDNHQRSGKPVFWSGATRLPGCFCTAFGHHCRWNEFDGEGNPGWNENDVVQVAKDRDEVGNQVYGAEGIKQHQSDDNFGVPGGFGVTECKQQCIGLIFQLPGSMF